MYILLIRIVNIHLSEGLDERNHDVWSLHGKAQLRSLMEASGDGLSGLRVPLPSVEEPEGADIPTKKSSYDTADNLFYSLNNLNATASRHCFSWASATR